MLSGGAVLLLISSPPGSVSTADGAGVVGCRRKINTQVTQVKGNACGKKQYFPTDTEH